MSNIKEIVSLVCSILEEIGCTPLQPETFRRGKFDDSSAVDDFWKLLFELICFKRTGVVKQSNFPDTSPISDMAVIAKREMFLDGYDVAAFISLPIVTSDQCSSRELLLAFGWLIATGGIFEQFAKQCVDVDYLYTAEVKRQLALDYPKSAKSPRNQPRLDLEQKIQEALVINGKLQTLFKSIAQADREHLKLLQRLECASSSPDILKNPSTIWIALSGQNDLILEATKLLQRDKKRLTYLVHWRQQEHIFWQWLESVIDEKQQNAAPVSPEALKAGYCEIMGDSYKKMTDFLLQASRSEKTLRDIVKGVTPEEADRLVELINNDLDEFLKPASKTVMKTSKVSDDKIAKASSRFSRHSQAQCDSDKVKSADLGLQRLCDRLELELKVNQKEFSNLLKQKSESTFGSSF